MSEISQTEYVRWLQNSTRVHSKKLVVVKFTFSQISRTDVPIKRCCFVTFCKQQQRNKQEIIPHAYTDIALVAVAVAVAVEVSGADLGGGCRGCAPLPEMRLSSSLIRIRF